MWSTILVILQIIKVFLDLWKEKDTKKVAVKATVAKEIVDAFAKTDPDKKASELNNAVSSIRLRKRK